MSVQTRPTLLRLAVAGPVAAALVAVPLSAASAHVTVAPESTTAGGYTVLTFRVPNESDTAGTTRLEVALPTDTPLSSVRSEPVAGWDAEVVSGPLPEPVDVDGATITEAPLSVVWTAQPGTEIGQDQFQRFVLSVGPLPEAGTTVVLPATQSYSDGEVVAWDEPVAEGEEEPERPAPSLVTTAPETDETAADGDASAAADAPGAASEAVSDGGSDGSSDDMAARVLGGGGLLLGAGALTLAATRGRRKES